MRTLWRILWQIFLPIWWVIRLGGLASNVRDTYQVLVYLATYGPSFLAVTALGYLLDFGEQMPLLFRVVFFTGIFFCALAITGFAAGFAIKYFPQAFLRVESGGAAQQPTPSNSSLWQEINRRESEHRQEKEQLKYALDTLNQKVRETRSISPEVASVRDISRQSFWIVDLLELAGNDSTIVSKNFEDCVIYGPGIITREGDVPEPESGARRGNSAIASLSYPFTGYIEGSEESVFHEVASGGRTASGVIHLVGCSFYNVRFRDIGIAGSQEELQWWKDHCRFSEEPANE